MIKKYIAVCALAVTHAAFAAQKFPELQELCPNDRTIFFNGMRSKGIAPSNIVAATLDQNEEHKKGANDIAMVHALFHPFNWHNAKLVTAPIMAVCGSAITYSARKSPQLRWISAACGLVGACYFLRTWRQLGSFATTCKTYREDACDIKEEAQLQQLSQWNRFWVRKSNTGMTVGELTHIPEKINFPQDTNWVPLYWGDLYLQAYQRGLDMWRQNQSLLNVSLHMKYQGKQGFDILVPAVNYQPAEGQVLSLEATSAEGNIHYKDMLNMAMLKNKQVKAAYEQGQRLRFTFGKGEKDLDIGFDSDTCVDAHGRAFASLSWINQYTRWINVDIEARKTT
jgi:hypothetical protein